MAGVGGGSVFGEFLNIALVNNEGHISILKVPIVSMLHTEL